MSESPTAAQLLADAAWLKRLATTLAGSEADAEDLVQQSWMAAWLKKPDPDRPLRPWLSKVVRDLAGMRRRADRRREAREQAVTDDEVHVSQPDELLDQMRLHRLLVDLVLDLDEPYRSAIIARFVEGRTAASIARSQQIPESTVRGRLRDGLALLRTRLDAARGDREGWAPAVLAFAKGGMQVAKSTKLFVAVIATLLLMGATAVIIFALRPSPGPAPRRVRAPTISSEAARWRVASEAPASHVSVAVADAAGPIANAVVRCSSTDGEIVIAPTARDGIASVDLAAGEWSIAASADGHEPSTVSVPVVAGHDAHVSLVLLVGGQTLTGTVVDASGGAIRDARIDAAVLDANTNPGRAVAVAFTDSAGRYKLSVGSGLVLVAASHPEYAAQTRYTDVGASGATADFALVPGGVIEGLVRDVQTKQPVVGASVRARHDVASLELAEARERVAKSDADGRFRLAGLRPGVYELSARAGALSTRAPVRVGLGVAEQQSNVVVLVGPAATVRGKVVDETGAPVAAVTVRANNGYGHERIATSDDVGAFMLEGLPSSSWALEGTSSHYLMEGHAIVELKTIDVDGVIVHVRHGLEVKGHVEPRQVCDVELPEADTGDSYAGRKSMMATTNDSGDFRFAVLAPGTATVAARCPSGDEGIIDVTVAKDDSEHIIPVKPGGSIAGRIIDAAGKPIVGVTVATEIETDGVTKTTIVNSAMTSGVRTISSTGGAFEIRGLRAATYRLVALDRGSPMKTKTAVKVVLSTAQHAAGIEIVVERPAGTIRGTVIGPDGAPAADAWVALHQTVQDLVASNVGNESRGMTIDGASAADLPPALSDARGHFELTNVPNGRYQVIAEAQPGELRGRAADVTPDAEIAIKLVALSTVRGTVHGPHGPTDLFSVWLAGPTSEGGTFTDGAFELTHVDPGDYTMEVTSSEGTGRATAHVSAGRVVSVDVALAPKGTVTGRLVDRSGKALAGMGVTLNRERPEDQATIYELPPTSGPDGRFQVEGEVGRMMLIVVVRPPVIKRGLVIEAGKTIDVGDIVVNEQP